MPQPEFISLEDGHTGMLLSMRKKARRTTGEAEAQQLKSASGTDAKVLAGAISSFAREGRRMNVTAIGAGSINQAVKAIAIARKNVRSATRLEHTGRRRAHHHHTLLPRLTSLPRSSALQVEEEAIDLTCKPEFTEVNEGTTALRMLLLVEQT